MPFGCRLASNSHDLQMVNYSPAVSTVKLGHRLGGIYVPCCQHVYPLTSGCVVLCRSAVSFAGILDHELGHVRAMHRPASLCHPRSLESWDELNMTPCVKQRREVIGCAASDRCSCGLWVMSWAVHDLCHHMSLVCWTPAAFGYKSAVHCAALWLRVIWFRTAAVRLTTPGLRTPDFL